MGFSFIFKRPGPQETENAVGGGSGFVRSNYVDSGGWPALYNGTVGTTNATNWVSGSADQQWAGYIFPSAVSIIKVRMNPGNHDANFNRAPITFDVRASNSVPSDYSSDGTLIYSVVDDPFWSRNEWREWSFTNPNAYTIYWIYMTDKEDPFGKAGEYVIGEIEFHKVVS